MPIELNFPSNPSVDDQYSFSDKTWKWNGDGWEKVGGAGAAGAAGATGATGATGAIGATGPVGDYVISWNGLTGAVDVTNSETIIGGVTLGGGGATFSSDVTAPSFFGGVIGSLHMKIKADEAIAECDPVYITGNVGASDTLTVAKADASNPAKMPAAGLADSTLSTNDQGHMLISGTHDKFDTSGYTTNQTVYVADGGGLTSGRPTGAGSLIQNIARAGRIHASTGTIIVTGAGRSNDVPNALLIHNYIETPGGYTTDTLVGSWNGLTGAVDVTNSEILIGGVTLDGGGGATFAEVTVHGGITASGDIRGANFIVPDDGFIGVASNDDRIVFDTNLNTIAVRSDTVEIQRLLEHLGDSNTYLEFTTDDVAVQAGGNTFLHGTSTYAEFGGVTFAGGGATFAEVTVLGGITASGALYVGQGATFGGNITAPTFVGDLTGDVTGTSSVATVATTVTITDNESTAEDNAIIFAAGGDVDGGNLGLESDGTLTYNPSTGKVTTTILDAAVNASALNINSNYNLPTGAGATGDVLMIANDGDLEFESLKTTATFIVDSDVPLATGIRYKGLFAVPMAKMDVVSIEIRSHDVSPAGSGDSLSVALKFIRTGLESASPTIQGTVETVVIPLGGQYHTAVTEANVDTPSVGSGNAADYLVVDVVSNAGNHTNFTMLVTMEARP